MSTTPENNYKDKEGKYQGEANIKKPLNSVNLWGVFPTNPKRFYVIEAGK